MTIDRKKLVDLLIEKTDLSQEEVEIQLDQLIERILDAAERGKALEIKEFGLFFFDQEGDLKFEPSEELSTEISFKYAGMKPVELKPERNTAIPDDDDPAGSISAADDVIVVPKSDRKSPSLNPKKSPETKPASASASASASKIRQPIRQKKDRSGVWALLAFFIVLIIGAIIYFNRPSTSVTDTSVSVSEPSSQESDIQNYPEPQDNTETEIENNDTSTEIVEETYISEGSDEEQNQEVSVPIQNQIYGLTGEFAESVNTGYSIVVYSLYNDFRAEEVAEELRADGYRVKITTRVVDGLDVYRISLGLFESIPDAQAAAETLPEPFNENNFIQRIQL
mgnify:CR=1 FL=1|tara:strand:+ start:42864 stop:43877 length:1014 start_codon:yes stop_codon:yes gene_type:complete